MKKFKRFLSVLIAVSVMVTAICIPASVLATAFKSTIDAFEYKDYSIPAYDGDLYEVIEGNVPHFTSSQLNQNIYEKYGKLDSLGRVTACIANIDKSLKGGKREDISSVHPTGWVQKAYSFVSGGYLYNRSHLIAHQLTGENANKNNLMTGTCAFNQSGMVPFENQVAAYVQANDNNNVLYRVTPVFEGDNLLANGVIMEAESVDDHGASVCFCVFVYNVQSGVAIDYSSGQSVENGKTLDLSGAYIELSKKTYAYTGKLYKPAVTVSLDFAKISPSDYSVRYTNNKNVGTATVTVTGKGSCTGSKKITFRIVPKTASISKLTPAKKALTVKWRRQTVQTNGYQIQYSTSAKFKSAKAVTVKSNKTAQRKITGLKAKKKYYVRIRTFKNVGSKRYYSAWSTAKSIKTK